MIRRLRQETRGIARRLGNRWRNWTGNFGLVLIYHRITPQKGTDPQQLCTTPAHFSEQLDWLRRHFDVIPLGHSFRGRRGRPWAAITFDDGYADNLHHALPVLEQYDVPASIFVATGYVGSDREFWWDELERIVLDSAQAPECLRIEAGLVCREWPKANSLDRWAVYEELHRMLKPMSFVEQRSVLWQLRETFAGVPPVRASHRPLRTGELVRLAASPLIQIGGHTVHHVSLGSRPVDEQVGEVRESVQSLKDWTGSSVTCFSYPYGCPSDIGDHATRLVEEAGCSLARANVAERCLPSSDRLRIPGFLVRDWDGETIAKRIARYLSGMSYDAN